MHPELTPLNAVPVSDDKSEIRVFGVVQNEELRLPYFFEYYRKLGVKHFFIIDNKSTDGTQAFLLQQPDCSVFFTAGSYQNARFGVHWLNSLLNTFGTGHWILLLDADELLVFPRCEERSLAQFCSWMEGRGYQGMFALLLDMYSSKPFGDVKYAPGTDFLKTCDYFDSAYHFVPRLQIPLSDPPFPAVEPIGGPRTRLCFPEQNTKSSWPRLRIKVSRRLIQLARKFGLLKNVELGSVAPQIFKVPLVKWDKGYGFITSHRLQPIKLASVTGALLHFKYFQDFSGRVQHAVQNLNHYDGSAEYKKYGELMARDPHLTFMDKKSVLYRSSSDLVGFGLAKTDASWEGQ